VSDAAQLTLFGSDTLTEARASVEAGRVDGITCPCCDQFCREYARSLNSPMARALIACVRRGGAERWVNIHELPLIQGRRGGGDFAKLVYWELIRQRPKDDDSRARTSGDWMVTDLGVQFACNRVRVRKKARLYNDMLLCFEGEYISIVDALGIRFDYRELMGWHVE
jgi:hypothetical protein